MSYSRKIVFFGTIIQKLSKKHPKNVFFEPTTVLTRSYPPSCSKVLQYIDQDAIPNTNFGHPRPVARTLTVPAMSIGPKKRVFFAVYALRIPQYVWYARR